jgi:protein TonB
VIGRDSQTYNSCHFSQEFLAVPGVALAADPSQNPVSSSSGTDQTIIQLGRDVTRPKPLKTPDPEFSPEARQAKFQGTVTLVFVVDHTGRVRNIRILRPLGCGLDNRAVNSVAEWKFSPATKGGEPVAVELHADMDFHLY